MQFNYHIPTRILFGPGKLAELSTEKLPGKKALIVITGGKSMKANGYLERVVELLKKNDVQSVVFDKIMPNPILRHVMEGAELARKEQCDFVIGLGGGSSIDSAKSIAVMAKNEGDYWDYIGGGTGKGKPVTGGVLPIVAITTTAGTGTEADPWTVITHEERNEKIGFGIPETFPVLSIVDPELMLTVPPKLTAYQGFDAFFHAAEGVIAKIATPVSDIYALKSIELINTYLPTAVANGQDIDARTNVALANTLSGFVESTSSCTSEHSLEHALSAYYPELPHGAGLIILSEAYFSFFAEKVPDRLVMMAKAMGKSTDGVEESKQPYLFVEALVELQEKCGVRNLKLSDYGIKKEDIPKFAKNAFETMGFLFTLDRYKLSMDDVITIFTKAYK
ncbi:iron-containing alcohol dehydrogenase [Desulfopila aestuarii]|uniref:Alcohol dehydrogenase n=1 Tax=Desulfopila aestuarii DSM 18488 TaxID=1121416 RepID=A0A1M7Y8R0_9BACT|nr:iron-containing alcohol dehydrogenase [Desulfopila aestuarii]SHO49022.1 alcohol dehydrogenase [Desulfopila aestuarii DSM 18488]